MTSDEEIKLAGEAARGSKAQALLGSQIYLEAVSAVENGIVEAWKASPVRDVEGQNQLRLLYKALADVRGYIETVAETGKMAQISLESARKRK